MPIPKDPPTLTAEEVIEQLAQPVDRKGEANGASPNDSTST